MSQHLISRYLDGLSDLAGLDPAIYVDAQNRSGHRGSGVFQFGHITR